MTISVSHCLLVNWAIIFVNGFFQSSPLPSRNRATKILLNYPIVCWPPSGPTWSQHRSRHPLIRDKSCALSHSACSTATQPKRFGVLSKRLCDNEARNRLLFNKESLLQEGGEDVTRRGHRSNDTTYRDSIIPIIGRHVARLSTTFRSFLASVVWPRIYA